MRNSVNSLSVKSSCAHASRTLFVALSSATAISWQQNLWLEKKTLLLRFILFHSVFQGCVLDDENEDILVQIQEEQRQFPRRFAWRLHQVGKRLCMIANTVQTERHHPGRKLQRTHSQRPASLSGSYPINVAGVCVFSAYSICVSSHFWTPPFQGNIQGLVLQNPTVRSDFSAYTDNIEVCTRTAQGCQALMDITDIDLYLIWTSFSAGPLNVFRCPPPPPRLFNAGSTRETSPYCSNKSWPHHLSGPSPLLDSS